MPRAAPRNFRSGIREEWLEYSVSRLPHDAGRGPRSDHYNLARLLPTGHIDAKNFQIMRGNHQVFCWSELRERDGGKSLDRERSDPIGIAVRFAMKSLRERSPSRPRLRIAFNAVAKAIDRLFTKPWFGARLVAPLQTVRALGQNEVSAPMAPIAEQEAFVTRLPSVQRTEFPPTLLFEPDATAPSVGSMALTGRPLPGGAVGLVIQLNPESVRHFTGDPGIANISIPIETVSTFRFGIYGVRARPRCEFELRLRYVSWDTIAAGVHRTSVMGYGFTSGETDRRDIRLHVPLAARNLGQVVQDAGLVPPAVGDLALLEWPTAQDPAFGLTFLHTQSLIYRQALKAFGKAIRAGQLVGGSSCWLDPGISPPW